MFSSYLQAGLYGSLNGKHDLADWQWLLVMDAIIAIAVIIPQMFFFPDVPARQKSDYVLNEADIELARDRNPKEGRVKQGAFMKAQV
ncbi:hypothetical protein BDZ45DRAFT_667372 [Acephala macrosclerotiorum]|nr:hypothetical protein BDZ45DRAFT_667372 [Acephala macrosclerotiorum]